MNYLLHDHKESLLLGNGLHIKIEVTGVVSLDLSGSLSVSLWNKNARSLVRNRYDSRRLITNALNSFM